MAFSVPQKRIHTPADMGSWQASAACTYYTQFIRELNSAVMGKSNETHCVENDIISRLVALLDTLDKWVDEIPPLQQPQRFGNQSFKKFHARLVERGPELIQNLLPETVPAAVPELLPYLTDGFGNSTRIDYGTGHEASFIMFLCCLWRLQVLSKSDAVAVVTKVFRRYLEVCRRLQLTYKMEPAGSHGVWSLDDFQFVPFIWGSAQLVDHPVYDPRSYLDETTVSKAKNEFLWMECIDFIGKVKTGPFAEHSNQLWSISAVPSWSKVNSGLVKMYQVEVLQKFPVAQHFLFGSILSFEPLS